MTGVEINVHVKIWVKLHGLIANKCITVVGNRVPSSQKGKWTSMGMSGVHKYSSLE